MLTGKVESGSAVPGDLLRILQRATASETPADASTAHKLTHIFCTRGATDREPVAEARAGDIVTIAGAEADVSDTVAAAAYVGDALTTTALTPPTVAMTFSANSGPLKGKSGAEFVNSNQIKDRLRKELLNNVTLEVRDSAVSSESMEVRGKGELQLGILVENMRREGYEMLLSPPEVLLCEATQEHVDAEAARIGGEAAFCTGDIVEPVEEVVIDLDQEHAGMAIERMALLKGDMKEYKELPGGEDGTRVRLIFHVTSRGLMVS